MQNEAGKPTTTDGQLIIATAEAIAALHKLAFLICHRELADGEAAARRQMSTNAIYSAIYQVQISVQSD